MKMKNMEIVNKTAILSICGVILLMLAITGITYAAFTVTGQSVTNSISTGTIVFSYSEPSNALTLTNALPMTDADGMISNNYFDFTVTATTSSNLSIPYEISGTKVAGSINNQYIKMYLTYANGNVIEGTFEGGATDIDSLMMVQGIRNDTGDFMIISDSINANQSGVSKNYRLRIWISSDYQIVSGVTENYSLRVNVDAIREPLN